MAKPFYNRLKNYFEKVGEVLRGEAEVSSIFPNTSDIGVSRELIYAEFLKQHVPSKCNIFLGGFLFGKDGTESKPRVPPIFLQKFSKTAYKPTRRLVGASSQKPKWNS